MSLYNVPPPAPKPEPMLLPAVTTFKPTANYNVVVNNNPGVYYLVQAPYQPQYPPGPNYNYHQPQQYMPHNGMYGGGGPAPVIIQNNPPHPYGGYNNNNNGPPAIDFGHQRPRSVTAPNLPSNPNDLSLL